MGAVGVEEGTGFEGLEVGGEFAALGEAWVGFWAVDLY